MYFLVEFKSEKKIVHHGKNEEEIRKYILEDGYDINDIKRIVPEDEIDDPILLIEIASSKLEGSNYHSYVDFPFVLYNLLNDIVDDTKKLKIARIIKKMIEEYF